MIRKQVRYSGVALSSHITKYWPCQCGHSWTIPPIGHIGIMNFTHDKSFSKKTPRNQTGKLSMQTFYSHFPWSKIKERWLFGRLHRPGHFGWPASPGRRGGGGLGVRGATSWGAAPQRLPWRMPSGLNIPSGNHTWQWKIPHEWRFIARKITDTWSILQQAMFDCGPFELCNMCFCTSLSSG